MTAFAPAVDDTDWLSPSELYHCRGEAVERTRPIYQGDVFANVPWPMLSSDPPITGPSLVEFETRTVLVLPHPCQCYKGDELRNLLTVAPVVELENWSYFGSGSRKGKDRFGLPDLHGIPGSKHAADFSALLSIPSRWLALDSRIACLSWKGYGLLAKRILGFQLRADYPLSDTMRYTSGEWNESFAMQAWVERHGSLTGYTAWMWTETHLTGVGPGDVLIKPYEIRESALDVLLAAISGMPIKEPT